MSRLRSGELRRGKQVSGVSNKQMSGFRCQVSENRCQMTDDRRQKEDIGRSLVRRRRPRARNRERYNRFQVSGFRCQLVSGHWLLVSGSRQRA